MQHRVGKKPGFLKSEGKNPVFSLKKPGEKGFFRGENGENAHKRVAFKFQLGKRLETLHTSVFKVMRLFTDIQTP